MSDSLPIPTPNSDPTEILTKLHKLAIDAALTGNWDKAIDLNEEIIESQPENIDSLNRLARALFEIGRYSKAKKIYQEVLRIDPYNNIAQKNLKRLTLFKKDAPQDHKNSVNGVLTNHSSVLISPNLFLEEDGITKVVNLIKLTEPQKLSKLYSGEIVKLITKNRGICVTDNEGNYLGVLADDTAHLLLKLIKGGNKYQALIKSVRANALTILIREVFRSKKFRNQPSFLDSARSQTYSSDHITLSYEEDVEDTTDQDSDEMV